MMKFLTETQLQEKTELWGQAAGFGTSQTVSLKKPALLVLDMQNEFLTTDGQMQVWGGEAIIPRLKNLLKAFRVASLPVFFTRHLCIEPYRHQGELAVMENVTKPDLFLSEGSFGAKFHNEMQPIEHEHVVSKYRYSAFYDTPLDTLLRVNGVTDVIVTGVATNICCEATAHDAYFRNFNVFFAIDGCGATDEDAHIATLKNISLVYGTLVFVETIIDMVSKMKMDQSNRQI